MISKNAKLYLFVYLSKERIS